MQFAPLYPLIYRLLRPAFPQCLWAGSAEIPAIALTFDDGPHPTYTPPLLEVLDHYQVPASFFWLGQCVTRSPEVAKTLYARGHQIGLHGYTHRSFPRLSAPALKASLEQTQAAIATACQIPLPTVQATIRSVRPPNGIFTPQTLHHLHHWGYQPIMWSVVPEDWVNPGIPRVIARILQQVTNGSVIVLHDGYYGGAAVADTVAQLIPLLQQQYQFVTINQLSCL